MEPNIVKQVSESFDFNLENPLTKKYLILFSGGMDSTALVEILTRFIAAENISLLHCDYGLRGYENEAEREFFKKTASAKKIKCYFHFHDLKQYPHNVQAKAREVRYQQAQEILKKNQLDYIVTGHHLDDFLETFFLKLLAGSSLEAAVSMHAFKKGRIIRPLLFYPKKQIKDFVDEQKVKFLQDSSNLSDKYQRNFLRNEIFKNLDQRFRNWRSNVLLFSKKLLLSNQMKKNQIAEKWAEVRQGFIFLKEGFFHLNAELRVTILHCLISEMYPEKRFSKNFFLSINEKIATGLKSKALFRLADRKIIYSYKIIGEEFHYQARALKSNSFVTQHKTTIFFNFAAKKKSPSSASDSSSFIEVSNPRLAFVYLQPINLLSSVFYRGKKIVFKKLFSNHKIPQMIRNNFLVLHRGETPLAILNPNHHLKLAKVDELIKELNHCLARKSQVPLAINHGSL